MTKITNQSVLITGAAGGLGRCLAIRLAELGNSLILWDSDKKSLTKLAQDLRLTGCQVHTYICDLSDRNQIHQNLNMMLSEKLFPGILINNAGMVRGKPIIEQSEQSIEDTFKVNVLAPIYLTRALIPMMISRGEGHIVFISSASALCGIAKLTSYSASKYALAGFEEALYFEADRLKYPIRTTIVFPYYFNSGMFSGVTSRFPYLLPILQTEIVAQRIINSIKANNNRVFIPRFIYVSLMAKILPRYLFAKVIDFFAINRSMDYFTGRPAPTGRHLSHGHVKTSEKKAG